MEGASELLRVDRAERQKAQLLAVGVVVLVAIADAFAYGLAGGRLAVWGGLAAAFLLSSAVMRRGPLWVTHACSIATLVAALVAVVILAGQHGGVTSPYFLVLPAIPLLVVAVVPDDLVVSGIGGLLVFGGGLWLLGRAGRPLADLVTWGFLVLVFLFFAVGASLRQRLRRERSVAAELGRARALEQLAESEKARLLAERWASIGLLAEGVAHDVNSPLASLRSNLAFAREELAGGRTGELDEALADAQQGVERIREIVASLQAFSLSETEAAQRRALADPAEETPAPRPARPAPAPGTPIARRPR